MSSNNLSSITVTASKETMSTVSIQVRADIDGCTRNLVEIYSGLKNPGQQTGVYSALEKIFGDKALHPANRKQFCEDIAKESADSLNKGNNPCTFTLQYQTQDGFDKTDVEVEL